jgi:hypothetical protein
MIFDLIEIVYCPQPSNSIATNMRIRSVLIVALLAAVTLTARLYAVVGGSAALS